MLRAGRVNFIMVAGLASIVILFFLLFFTRNSPTNTVGDFLTALAKGNVDQLVELSHYDGNKDDLRKQWEFAVKEAGPHFRFTWKIIGGKESDATHAAVNVQWTKDALGQGYEKKYEVPCVKVDGSWKVDISAVARDMYPALPQ